MVHHPKCSSNLEDGTGFASGVARDSSRGSGHNWLCRVVSHKWWPLFLLSNGQAMFAEKIDQSSGQLKAVGHLDHQKGFQTSPSAPLYHHNL